MNELINIFDKKFNNLHRGNGEVIIKIQDNNLFTKPTKSYKVFSSGEYILRSAAKVEQTFGGIMSRLWDDPFEWTLPEELSSKDKILDYLNEVEETRLKGFAFFKSDDDLKKEIITPDGKQSLLQLLIETLIKAEKLQSQAILINTIFDQDETSGL